MSSLIIEWIEKSLKDERTEENNINKTDVDFIYEVWALLPYNSKSFIYYNDKEINTCVTLNKSFRKEGYIKLLEIEPNTTFEAFLQIILSHII